MNRNYGRSKVHNNIWDMGILWDWDGMNVWGMEGMDIH